MASYKPDTEWKSLVATRLDVERDTLGIPVVNYTMGQIQQAMVATENHTSKRDAMREQVNAAWSYEVWDKVSDIKGKNADYWLDSLGTDDLRLVMDTSGTVKRVERIQSDAATDDAAWKLSKADNAATAEIITEIIEWLRANV